MKILSKTNKFYPKRLLNIQNPPSKLYVEGNYELLNSNSIAIVGTRKCTKYGEKYSAKFAKRVITKRNVYCKWISNWNRHCSTYKFHGRTRQNNSSNRKWI